MEDSLPQGSDSGGGVYGDTTLHLMNLFLYKVKRAHRSAGGEGLYDISRKTSNEISFSSKSVFSPARNASNLCFWECLFFFLVRRYEGGFKTPEWYSSLLIGAVNLRKKSPTQYRVRLNQYIASNAIELKRGYYRISKETFLPNVKVELEEFGDILTAFGCFNEPLILDVDGDALIGDLLGAERRMCEGNEFTAIYHNEHLYLVLSYTGSLIVKKCRRCDSRFASNGSLSTHLNSGKCMTCVCLGKGEYFDDELEWQRHMTNRETLCPKYRLCETLLSASNSSTRSVDDESAKIRFVNDDHETYYSKRKKAQDELEKDVSPIRTYNEAIYFDLESIVPMNEAGKSGFEHDYQIPYACGWILRSAALNGDDVEITYGKNCMGEFVAYLDGYYEVLKENETNVWLKRAIEGVNSDPIPRKTRGYENYARRVKSYWDNYIGKLEGESGCLKCGEFLETAHGYTSVGDHYTFSNCALLGYAKSVAEKNMETNFNDNAPRIPIWAHNGGKYDWLFFHRYMMEKGLLDELRTVRSSSKYFQLTYKGVFEFKDSMNFMMGSLDKLGKDFGVETLKGLFPYRLLDTIDKIDKVISGEEAIRENIPHDFFQISEKLKGPMGVSVKRTMTEEEYVDFFSTRGWEYSIRGETIKYLKDDVMCLYGVVEKFREGWLGMPHSPELFKYCTIGQMCHTYFLDKYLEENMYPCLDVCEDAHIRKALYGGRTEVFRRFAPPGSKIHYVDVNSLYPYVMESRDLPCGDPVWHFRSTDPTLFQFTNSNFPILTKVCEDSYFEDIQTRLNSGESTYDIYGFLEVDVRCNLELSIPVLPERRSLDGGKTFKNMFTNMHKEKMVYYSEELKRAIEKGCVVTKVWSFSKWQRGRVYGKLIRVLKEQKLLGEGKDVDGNRLEGVPKNPSLRAAAKTAQNSLFGKTIQFIDSSVELVHNRDRFFKAIDTAFSKVSIKPVFRTSISDVVEVTSRFEIAKVQRRSCAAIGTAILAEARLVLYDYFEKAKAVGGEILYCDTDSIVFAGDSGLTDDCMDDSAYGKMKVEIDPNEISPGGFVGMSPKCYAFQLKNGDPYVRCKGVNLSQNLDVDSLQEEDGISALLRQMESEELVSEDVMKDLSLPIEKDEVVSTGLSFAKMRELVVGDLDALVMKQMQFRKTTDRMISAYENVKVMRSKFDKRFLGDDGKTFAWNDFNMNMDRIVSMQQTVALSDYLSIVSVEELNYVREKYRESSFFRNVFESWQQTDCQSAILYCLETADYDNILCS